MPSHTIRLRGPWMLSLLDSTTPSRRSFPLPTWEPWPTAAGLVLSRSFQRPPIEPGREQVALALRQVDGLGTVTLNAVPLPVPAECDTTAGFELDVTAYLIPGTNRLALEVDPHRSSGIVVPWGEVALVIRTDP